MSDNGSELQVITKAKDLAEYVIIITHKTPKEWNAFIPLNLEGRIIFIKKKK